MKRSDWSAVTDALIEKAEQAIPKNPEDYIGEDGLLYCGKCRTAKQQRVTIFGKERTPMVLCDCEQAKRDVAREEIRRADVLERLRGDCFADRRMVGWSFANDNGNNPKLSQICRNFVDHFDEMKTEGRGLLLFGKSGTGKSWFAASIANALIEEREIRCKFRDFTQIANEVMRPENKDNRDEYIDKLAHYPLLVLDDLWAERDTSYMREVVFAVLDARVKSGLPLVATTNLSNREMRDEADVERRRLVSRVWDVTVPYEVVGNDQREKKLIEDYARFKDLLGI